MTAPFLAEIQLFAFKIAPRGWAFCNGATLPLQQASALFSLLGVAYGGDGRTTFQLPNFTTRAPCEQGKGPVTSPRVLGATFGADSVALGLPEMPAHNHGLTFFTQADTTKRSAQPSAGSALSVPTDPNATPYMGVGAGLNTMFAPNMLTSVGSGEPHPNRQPYLALNFCIALEGVFPTFG